MLFATTFISTAIGVGNAVIAMVVLVAPISEKYSPYTSLKPIKSLSMFIKNTVTSCTFSRVEPAASKIVFTL